MLVAGLWLGVAQFLPTDKNLLTCGVPKKDIESQFSYGYYLMLVGGLFSLGAAAFNLLFARTAAERRRSVRTRFRCVYTYPSQNSHIIIINYVYLYIDNYLKGIDWIDL